MPHRLVCAAESLQKSIATFSAFALHEGYGQHSGKHVVLTPAQINWNDLPALPGVKIAVIQGPLTEAVPIMFRLKFPANS